MSMTLPEHFPANGANATAIYALRLAMLREQAQDPRRYVRYAGANARLLACDTEAKEAAQQQLLNLEKDAAGKAHLAKLDEKIHADICAQELKPDWVTENRANPIKEFCEEFCNEVDALQLPALNPADQAPHAELQILINEANAALVVLHEEYGKRKVPVYSSYASQAELQNQLNIVKAKIAAINAYFARAFGKTHSSVALSVFEKDQGQVFFARTQQLTEHFSGMAGQVKSMFKSLFSRDQNNYSEEVKNNQMLTIRPAFSREGTKPIDVSRRGLLKAEAAFKAQHGERSVQIKFLANGKFSVSFRPQGSGILYAAYPQYQAYQAEFLQLLQAQAKAEAREIELRARAINPDNPPEPDEEKDDNDDNDLAPDDQQPGPGSEQLSAGERAGGLRNLQP